MNPIASRRNAAAAAGVQADRSTPATSRLPLLGVSIVPTRFRSVVLPLPDGPSTTPTGRGSARAAPASTVSDASTSTMVRTGPWSYHLLSPAMRMTGGAAAAACRSVVIEMLDLEPPLRQAPQDGVQRSDRRHDRE